MSENVEKRLEKARAVVERMCSGDGRWEMSVPVDLQRDSDIVITAALNDLPKLLTQLAEAQERERVLKQEAQVSGRISGRMYRTYQELLGLAERVTEGYEEDGGPRTPMSRLANFVAYYAGPDLAEPGPTADFVPKRLLDAAAERERALLEALGAARHSLITLGGLVAADAVAPEEMFTINESEVIAQIDAACYDVGAPEEEKS